MSAPASAPVARCLVVLLAGVAAIGCQGDTDADSAPAASVSASTQPPVEVGEVDAGDGVADCEAVDRREIEVLAGVELTIRASDSTDEVNGSITCTLERSGPDRPDGVSYLFVYSPAQGLLPAEETNGEILGQPAIIDQPTQQLVIDLGGGTLVQVRRGVRSAGADSWHPDRKLTEDELVLLGDLAVEAHRSGA